MERNKDLDLSAYWENQHICIKAERESLFVMNLTNCGLEGEKLFLKLLPTWEQKWKWEGHRVVRRLQMVLNSLLRRKCEKDRNLLLGVMLPALGSWTFLALLKSISALISYGCKREEDFFFFFWSQGTHLQLWNSFTFSFFMLMSQADLYYYVIMGSRDCVSLKVMACDCLLHCFQWDSVIAILRDSIPLKVIVWDCPHCYRAVNWIEFILICMGQHRSFTFKRCGIDKVFWPADGKFNCFFGECILLFKTFIS